MESTIILQNNLQVGIKLWELTDYMAGYAEKPLLIKDTSALGTVFTSEARTPLFIKDTLPGPQCVHNRGFQTLLYLHNALFCGLTIVATITKALCHFFIYIFQEAP